MLELDNATQAAKAHISALEEKLDGAEVGNETLNRENGRLQGRIDELTIQLAMAQNLRDQYLRWSVELTRQIHSIGMFANEAMRLARKELADAGKPQDLSKSNGDVLKTMEAELSETVESLGQAEGFGIVGENADRPIPNFLRAGPRPHSFSARDDF